MDFFLAICQALAFGLAVGAVAGAVGARGGSTPTLGIAAVVAGAAAGAFSMSLDDESIVVGILAGAVGGWLAATVIAAVVSGAARRGKGDAGSAGFIVTLAAAALVGLSLLISPVALVVLLALGWLAFARRRRADRKHEDLRILR